MGSAPTMTARQEKWFASVKASLERDTGKSLEEWVAIARTCPETKHRARLAWFKQTHGLLQNRASYVLSEAFPSEAGWDDETKLRETLWADPAAAAILAAVEAAAERLEGTIRTQRKQFTAFSRAVQYAAVRPVKGGKAMLGLALEPGSDPRLAPAKNEAWSERLKARLPLADPAAVDASVEALLKRAWDRS